MTNQEETTMENNEEVKNPEAVLAELRRAQEDLKALRAEHTALGQERDALKKSVEEDTWRAKALLAEAKNALGAQGIKDADRLMPYVGVDGLDFDDDGKVTGLDERLTQLKKDLPEIFDPKRRAGGKADIFADNSVEQKTDPLRESVRNVLNGG